MMTQPCIVTSRPCVRQLPARADTIVLRRGAWVEGRINVTRGAAGGVAVLGHGEMEGGRRFTYHGGRCQR